MPRQERQHSATGIYHVMLRGINKQDIFEDDEDYLQFLNILRALVDRRDEQGHFLPSHCTFYAFALLLTMCNHKYERDGHLFQDRFRSEPVNSIEYFMTLMRYIHQNPVVAGLADEVRDTVLKTKLLCRKMQCINIFLFSVLNGHTSNALLQFFLRWGFTKDKSAICLQTSRSNHVWRLSPVGVVFDVYGAVACCNPAFTCCF